MVSVYVCLLQTDEEYLEHVVLKKDLSYQFRMNDEKFRILEYKMSKETNNGYFAHFYFKLVSQ